LSVNTDEARRRADALFKKEPHLREGQQGMADYQVQLRAMRRDGALAGASVGPRRRQQQ
jgi:hypothetical protein